MCFDPLTLGMTILVNLDAIGTIFKFMRTNLLLVPLSLKAPVGFAGIFVGLSDIVIFTPGFGRAKHLRHPVLKGIPTIRQCHGKLFVWSPERVIWIYDLDENIDLIQVAGSFEVPAVPIDVAYTVDPELIHVACEDPTLRVHLGSKCEYPLRFPESKMTHQETQFANALLGPMVYTKSRPPYVELANYHSPQNACKIDACAISPELTVVITVYSDASISSNFIYSILVNVKALEFDELEYLQGPTDRKLVSSEFQEYIKIMNKKRLPFYELSKFLRDFGTSATRGQIESLFQTTERRFSLTKFISGISLHSRFTFLPQTERGQYSAYETFFYMNQSGILPDQISNFSEFLVRLTDPDIRRPVFTEATFNQVLPIRTAGVYNAVAPLLFDDDRLNAIMTDINPIARLSARLSRFTIADTADKEADSTTARCWLLISEKAALTRRVNRLTVLEDLVKHELMNRIQSDLNDDFTKHQLDRMVPVPLIDTRKQVPPNDCKNVTFSSRPNRNPLLDVNVHRSIYHTWATQVLFGRDRSVSVDLRALFIPSPIFSFSIVQAHIDLVSRLSLSTKKIISEVYAVLNTPDGGTQLMITDDSRALPLSHYLKIHSFLGGNSRILQASRSILSRVLTLMYQFHKSGVIVRTVVPDNIFLNAQTGNVSLGTVFDCQQMNNFGRPIYLPLPVDFTNPMNSFLPPEFFHEPPRNWTKAFDIWQFGILLLYVLTGFLPHSYGSALLKHVEGEPVSTRRVVITDSHLFCEPPRYPRCSFFYDWLKGCKLVYSAAGERGSCIGERGECFIESDRPGEATILDLDHYRLLPYKNTKLAHDEARLFLEIISTCLQIEPEKRPTVDRLLKTIPFSQVNQINDIMDQYMKQPDRGVFVREFFTPSLVSMGEPTFPFTLGIVAALIFHEEMAEEDAEYSFQLDSRAAEQVITSLFAANLMDRMVCYVLDNVERHISYNDVNPTIKFKSEAFNGLLRLVERFVMAIEHGHGTLLSHVDEVVMALLALYTGNPYIRYDSEELVAKKMAARIANSGSAPAFVFAHTHVKSLMQFALQESTYIMKTLRRTVEHNDGCFNQFIQFGESAFALAHAMCHSIEKQRANAISMMENVWNYGQITHVVRLFIDFPVPQMVIHCFLHAVARNCSCEFVLDAMAAIRLTSFEPTYLLLQSCVHQATVMTLCILALRMRGVEIRQRAVNIINRIFYGESASSIVSLVVSDILWLLAENSDDPLVAPLIYDALCFSSPFVMQIVCHTGSSFRSALGLDKSPRFDFPADFDFAQSLEIAKRLASELYIRQSSIPSDCKARPAPLQKAIDFLVRAINLSLSQAQTAASELDYDVKQATRFDLRGTTYLKAKNTARSTDFGATEQMIEKLCNVLLHLFRCICFYWREPGAEYPNRLFEFLLTTLAAPIPMCDSMPHPANLIHHCLQRMALHCLIDLPEDSPIRDVILEIQELWPRVMLRDLKFVMECICQDVVEVQLMNRYPEERRIRLKMFQMIVADKRATNLSPLLRFVVVDMLHNKTTFSGNPFAQQFHYPIRSEGINMVMFLLASRVRYETSVRRLVDELLISNFVKQEKRLTDSDSDQGFMDSSISFLRIITQCKSLFEENVLKAAQMLLESLCMRFLREWMNTSAFSGGAGSKAAQSPKRAEKATPGRTQSQMKPKLRALTPLGGELIGSPVGFSSVRTGGTSPRVTRKDRPDGTAPIGTPRKKTRPKTAFSPRKSS
jgi:serine/threonine protein kinase